MGKTCQKLEARLSQYKTDVVNQDSHSVLAVHQASITGHVFNFDKTRIVGGGEDLERIWKSLIF